ncbi:MAG: PmoA family protein, partial [Chloroflexi bacterium]|nr:PmoA family protein [Chloroflexota bacterium]
WPHVNLGEKHYDLWMIQGIHQKFERWLARQAGPAAAILGVENGWFVGEKKVVQERVWLRVYPAAGDEQSLDLEFVWIPIDQPLTLAGAEGKSYGGLTLRFATRTQTVITSPAGSQGDDAYMTRLPWADLTAQFAGAWRPSGAAVFIGPDHPDYPPTWLTRHYGVLCVGWPGVQPATFKPGEPIHGRYRVWIHRGAAGGAALARAYEAYKSPAKVTVSLAGAAEPQGRPTAVALRSELKPDRVSVYAGEKLFTEYLFLSDSKYPYFYPVNGPRTGQSVTTRNTEPYPHHSSLFFGCDRVNGGNYWQEGLERGRIVSKDVRLVRASGDQVVFEQDCRWERPGADPPFSDHRTIAISAPSPDLRYVDFDVTLTAETDVRIEKTNHSLFAARVPPDLAVTGGGVLVNAQGDQGEKATFGRPSPWADYRGTRRGETEGIAIFCHPGDRWYPSPWFTRDYGFFSPTPLNWLEKGYLELAKGEKLRLRYRVVVHAGALSQADLQSRFESWSKQ